MREAIALLGHDPLILEQDPSNTPTSELVLEGTQLRDVLLKKFHPDQNRASSEQTPHHLQDPADTNYVAHDLLEHPSRLHDGKRGAFSDDMRIHSWARRYRERHPVVIEGDPVLDGLNATQVRAIAMMIGERISLIQGVSEHIAATMKWLIISTASWDGKDEDNC